ncbi:MAG: NAD(P)H-dependent oxidoreductase subunit E [[Clostridium] scindens]
MWLPSSRTCPICMRRHSAMRSVSASPTDARPEEVPIFLKKLQELLKIKPGQVTKDGVFLLNTEYCMHNCMHGPNLKIDGRIYENVQISQLPQLLEQLRH